MIGEITVDNGSLIKVAKMTIPPLSFRKKILCVLWMLESLSPTNAIRKLKQDYCHGKVKIPVGQIVVFGTIILFKYGQIEEEEK